MAKRAVGLFILAALACGCVKNGMSKENKADLTNPPAPFEKKETLQAAPADPEMRNDGFFCGDKGIIAHKEGKLTLVSGGTKVASFFFYFKTPYSPWITTNYKGLMDTKIERDPKEKRFIFTGKVPLAKKGTANMPTAVYRQELKLQKDGKIALDIEYSAPENLKDKLQGKCLFFQIPFALCQGNYCMVDGKKIDLPTTMGANGQNIYSGRPKTFIFTPNAPKTEFGIQIKNKAGFWIRDRKQENMSFRVIPGRSSKLSILIDLGKVPASSFEISKDCHAGIDFWKSDRLHVPDYSKSKNLIQNPSFEAGLRYYFLHDTWGVFMPSDKPIYSTDESQSKFGNSSLLIIARKANPQEGYLQTFAIPVVEGKKYTVSFYAKGNKKGLRLDLRCITAKWMEFPRIGNCKVTKDWTRHSFTFTAPNRAATILIKGVYHGKDKEGNIWVDGLQLEEGEKATEYEEKPLFAQLLTSNQDNFLNLKDKINAKLKITSAPETEGSATCRIKNYFGKTVWTDDFKFRTDKKGVAEIALPLEGKLKKGIYVLRADFKLSNGFEDSDFFRISRMEFLSNKHKNKDIFASSVASRNPRTADIAERYKDIGIGSTNYVRPQKQFTDMYRKNGISISGLGIFSHGQKATKEMSKKIKKVTDEIKSWEKMTPEREKIIEEASYETAASMPWIDSWFFAGECEAGGGSKFKMMEKGNIEDFVKCFISTYKGVKRFDPNKKVYLCGGPCNMAPQNGIRWLDRYLTLVGDKVKFDGIAIHPYRTVPENPDLDDDTAILLKMLKKHGYSDVPVYWNEGIYYTYYNIPEWGLSPHKGCSTDHYRAYCPSYDMGWAEKISAAYFARSWLVALKYQDSIKQFNGWCSWMFMDAYLTPFALQKIPNTLGHLLGNASFKKDIRFAPQIRCYVFEDEKKRPVAALWSHIPKVDRGLERSPLVDMSFSGKMPEFINLMGNKQTPVTIGPEKVEIPATPFPLFIRGEAGSLEELCKSLENAKVKGVKNSPLQIGAKPLNESVLEIKATNLLSKKFKGELQLKLQGKTKEEKLILPKQGSADFNIPLPRKLSPSEIIKVELPIEIKEENGDKFKMDASFRGFACKKLRGKIAIDGNLDDWKNIPAIKMKNRLIVKSKMGGKTQPVGYKGDFEAFFKITWDEDFLYLAVQVKDDKFTRIPDKKGRFNWYNDTLQVYIDTFCDARSKSTKGFDGNDYNYDFFPDPKNNRAEVFRRFAPEQQIAGGLLAPKPNTFEANVKSCFKLLKDGYLYEIAFPKRLLAPMQLKTGSVVGWAIYHNDRDGEKIKSALTLTPPGTGGYMNPHLYPVMILVD